MDYVILIESGVNTEKKLKRVILPKLLADTIGSEHSNLWSDSNLVETDKLLVVREYQPSIDRLQHSALEWYHYAISCWTLNEIMAFEDESSLIRKEVSSYLETHSEKEDKTLVDGIPFSVHGRDDKWTLTPLLRKGSLLLYSGDMGTQFQIVKNEAVPLKVEVIYVILVGYNTWVSLKIVNKKIYQDTYCKTIWNVSGN